ncbi:hypothetical protein [Ureibacillus sinduriensis]|uniref:GerMN domain-containing protein n=1 Tax=Ureibacillus sinduriensis BLB-1 = JCM 15800 TaxID=1384057 RepID=A0A0A3IGZ1_9BACL|nr:hypothetical protein [Ureibacillus sinduriensis]KGR74107.1 hypothetical protein CD33_19125 [Ureibacillus sinduriensis BLB-1 = JCM 15800]
MNHDKWEDGKIEDLLGKVPKIHDQRSKEDVLKRLKEDGLFDDEPLNTNTLKTKQPKRLNWVPIVVSIAAIFILAVLIPSFMNRDSSSDTANESMETSTTESSDMQEMKISESTAEESEMRTFNTMETDLRTAVYPEEVEGNTLFKLGLASDAADSVPITVLIPNDIIQQDFGSVAPSGVELYNHYAPLFNESAIGFADYHPYMGTISELDDRVIHTLPDDQQYDLASGALTTYFASLVDTFSDSYEEVALLNEEGAAFTFSEVGEASTPIQLNSDLTQYNYFRHTQADGSTYLAPNFRESYSTVEEAISAMKEETNDIYQSVIIPEVDYEVNVENQIVTVKFKENVDLDSFDQVQAMQMIEGILLTAANFDMQVQFENVLQADWQGFDFTTILPKPVGPNGISYWTVFNN